MSRTTAKELAEIITDFVNSSNTEKYDEFVEIFSHQHRTLQQSAIGLMLRVIEHVASDDYKTDPRNEDSKKIARNLIDGFKIVKKQEYMDEGTSEAKAEEYVSTESGSKPSKYLGFV
jgi:hypothetical protein